MEEFLLGLVAQVVFLFFLYFVIRSAVRGGIEDAAAFRRWQPRRGGPPEPPAPAA